MRENRATIKDPSITDSFTEGVNEGFRLTGYVVFTVTVGGNEIVRQVIKADAAPALAGDVMGSFRGRHYDQGVVIRIMAADGPAEEGDDLPDGVIEGEVVEE